MQSSFKFPKLGNFSLVTLDSADASSQSDQYRHFSSLIVSNEEKYPLISRWLSQKVTPGIREGSRTAYMAMWDGRPVATAVFKRGDRAKICHLRILDEYQDHHLGEMFFTLMVMEARNRSSQLHFTLPESLWDKRRGFFEAFGFMFGGPAKRQYRHSEDEFFCFAPIDRAWAFTVAKLPKLGSLFSIDGLNSESDLLFSVRPEWARSILNGRKRVEIRRKFSTKWIDRSLSIYSCKPEGRIVGKARVEAVVPGAPSVIWANFGSELGCSREDFDSYVRGCSEVYAIVLTEVQPYANPVSISELSALVGGHLTAPQSYQCINAQSDWGKAMSLVSMLQSKAP